MHLLNMKHQLWSIQLQNYTRLILAQILGYWNKDDCTLINDANNNSLQERSTSFHTRPQIQKQVSVNATAC